jgi:hypothetical protein
VNAVPDTHSSHYYIETLQKIKKNHTKIRAIKLLKALVKRYQE